MIIGFGGALFNKPIYKHNSEGLKYGAERTASRIFLGCMAGPGSSKRDLRWSNWQNIGDINAVECHGKIREVRWPVGLLAFYQLIHETSQVHQLRGSGDQGWVPFNDEPLQQGARNTQKAIQRLSHLHIELWEKKQLCVLHLSRFCIPDQGHDMLELQFAHIWGGVKPPSRNQLMSFRFLLGFITLCHLPPGQRTFFLCRSGSVLGRMAKCNCKEPYPPVSPRWSRRWSGGDRWIPPWVLLAAASWLNPMKYSYVPHKHLETIVIGDDLPTKDRVFPDAAWFVGTKGIQAATVNPPAGRRVPRACQRTAHRSPATAQLWRQAGRAGWWKVGEWLVNIGSFDPSWGGRVRKREIPVTFLCFAV